MAGAISAWWLLALAMPGSAQAWGEEGHEVVGTLAYQRLTPKARKAVDALLARDKDTLTAPDFVSRTTWADKYRDSDRNTTRERYQATRRWHFVDIELAGGGASLDQACFGRPPLPHGVPASSGPEDACIVDKLAQFKKELADPSTHATERLLAFKFLLHFVGDLHQPLHASGHHDGGGNGVAVLAEGLKRPSNLHSYWDSYLIRQLGTTVATASANVGALITPAHAAAWSTGSFEDWAAESNVKARTVAYHFAGQKSFVDDHGDTVEVLDARYTARALPVVREALAKAAVRLAQVLNEVFR